MCESLGNVVKMQSSGAGVRCRVSDEFEEWLGEQVMLLPPRDLPRFRRRHLEHVRCIRKAFGTPRCKQVFVPVGSAQMPSQPPSLSQQMEETLAGFQEILCSACTAVLLHTSHI